MAKVKDVMKLIEETKITLDARYDMSMEHIIEIQNQSNSFFELVNNGFLLGYAQGMKAAKAEIKKAVSN